MDDDTPFNFDEEIQIGGGTYRRPIRTLHISAVEIFLSNSVSIIGEKWGAFVNESPEPPDAHIRLGLHCSGLSEDRLCIIGSKQAEKKIRFTICAAPDDFDGWRAWTASLGFSDNDGYWWVEGYVPRVRFDPLVEAYRLRRLTSVSLSLNLRDAFAEGADYWGQEPQWPMTWGFLHDKNYGTFTQAVVTGLSWSETPIRMKSTQDDEGPY